MLFSALIFTWFLVQFLMKNTPQMAPKIHLKSSSSGGTKGPNFGIFPQGRFGTLGGRPRDVPRTLPGLPQDAPGSLKGPSGTPQGTSGTLLGLRRDALGSLRDAPGNIGDAPGLRRDALGASGGLPGRPAEHWGRSGTHKVNQLLAQGALQDA